MNIYVGNLDYQITEEDLRDIFEEYGVVTSTKVVIDRESNRSKGFGFVEMQDQAEGQKAIEELNEAELEGRTMRVNVARERTDRRGGDRRGGNRGRHRSNNRDNNRY
ncbi:MAG: RNA recognition motif domain-containing protein [Chitinophagales bacterium]